jgi:hypothetical protein
MMAELAWPDLATASNEVGEGSGAEVLASERGGGSVGGDW